MGSMECAEASRSALISRGLAPGVAGALALDPPLCAELAAPHLCRPPCAPAAALALQALHSPLQCQYQVEVGRMMFVVLCCTPGHVGCHQPKESFAKHSQSVRHGTDMVEGHGGSNQRGATKICTMMICRVVSDLPGPLAFRCTADVSSFLSDAASSSRDFSRLLMASPCVFNVSKNALKVSCTTSCVQVHHIRHGEHTMLEAQSQGCCKAACSIQRPPCRTPVWTATLPDPAWVTSMLPQRSNRLCGMKGQAGGMRHKASKVPCIFAPAARLSPEAARPAVDHSLLIAMAASLGCVPPGGHSSKTAPGLPSALHYWSKKPSKIKRSSGISASPSQRTPLRGPTVRRPRTQHQSRLDR